MTKTFMLINGEGYVQDNDLALIKTVQLDFFTEEQGFDTYTQKQIRELYKGQSINIDGLMENASVVRIL
jgi:hypothetical protein